MTEADTKETATLLPQSAVAIYSNSAETKEAALKIADDWRFARVTLQVEDGDVETAARTYKEFRSPEVIIVQTDTIDEGFIAKLEGLAASCDEGTEAIIIGPDNDVYLYRKLIDMGVSDYLVRPVTTVMLCEVIAKALINIHGVTGARLIAFVGAKGGVGTSTIARNFGHALTGPLKQKVLLMDASGGLSTNPVGLGFEPSTTYKEAAKAVDSGSEDALARMLYKANDKLAVLASGSDVILEPTIPAAALEKMIDMLMVKYPVVLADLSGATPDLKKMVLSRANHIVLVSTANVSCLRLARTLMMEIKHIRGGEAAGVSLLQNMGGFAPGHELAKADIETAMEMSVVGSIPYDPKLFVRLESEGKALLGDKAGKEIMDHTILPLARNLVDLEGEEDASIVESGGLLSGFLGKLGKK